MQKYFSFVSRAEKEIFGNPAFTKPNVRTLSLKMGDLSNLDLENLKEALNSDYYIVFGASYIKNALCHYLVEKKAINIHMGVSPYYRGTACNFWALYDGHPEHVGATLHLLSSGLDSGPILLNCFPKVEKVDGFTLGMKAVEAAHLTLIQELKSESLLSRKPIAQDRSLEIRYSRNKDFTDAIAQEYLSRFTLK